MSNQYPEDNRPEFDPFDPSNPNNKPQPGPTPAAPQQDGWAKVQAEVKSKSNRKWLKPVAMIGGGLIVGSILGTSTAGTDNAELEKNYAVAQEQVKSLTDENVKLKKDLENAIASPQIEEKIVEKVVTKTPDICLTALDDGQTVIDLAADVIGIMGDGFGAASNLDVAGMESMNQQLNKATPKMQKNMLNWNRTSEACKTEGE